MTRLLADADVRQALPATAAVEVIAETLRARAAGRTASAKVTLAAGDGNFVMALPAHLGDRGLAAVKWVGGFRGNPAADRPYVRGMLILTNAADGETLAVMDAGWITAIRTGGIAAVAATHCVARARPTVALVGCGAVGRGVLSALAAAFDLGEVRAASRTREGALRFAREAGEGLGVKVRPAATAREAVEGADLVVTATRAGGPAAVVERSWVGPGAFVAALGSEPELDPALILAADKVVVDSWDLHLQRGELLPLISTGRFSREHVYAEVAEIVSGERPGRERPDEVIVGSFLGLGELDVGLAAGAAEEARRLGLGSHFAFEELRG